MPDAGAGATAGPSTGRPEPSATEPEPSAHGPGSGELSERVRAATDGLEPLVAQAAAVRQARAAAAEAEEAAGGGRGRPGKRPTEPAGRGAPRWTDVFTTQFTEFSNRPR